MVQCSDSETALFKWKAECRCIAVGVMCCSERICVVQRVQCGLYSVEGTANSRLMV